MLFFIYMLPLGDIICKYDVKFHCYADDTQLYVPVKPNDLSQLLSLEKLGVIFDSHLTFQPHIKSITKTAFFHLSNIAKIRLILSLRDAETVIHAFVSSRLDYCNVFLSGLPNCAIRSLQLVQNAAARILTKTRKYDHITPVLASLRWLPVQARADFKPLLFTYKAMHGLAPPYISELIIPPCHLRSLYAALLVIPSVNKKNQLVSEHFPIMPLIFGMDYHYMLKKHAQLKFLNEDGKPISIH
ncbi:hypothetical protein LDENG_00156130 [Lucifuga dentata]|nr:hypothetical protein LDENG_00156130 [Lucifuga dentata]